MERSARMVFSAASLSRILCAALCGFALGCGKSEPAAPLAAEPKAKEKPAVASATPSEAVHQFMMAFKNGDDAKADALLSDKARQEVERANYAVSPPGSKAMQFQVGEVEYVSDARDLAHVACQIKDIDPDGDESACDIVWFLRKEPRGWRIAGVAMRIFPDELPVLYNFEDMDDLEAKAQLVEDEMVRRAQQTLMQAQQPSVGEKRVH